MNRSIHDEKENIFENKNRTIFSTKRLNKALQDKGIKIISDSVIAAPFF